MAKWNSLQVHYLKHPAGDCKDCWAAALGKPAVVSQVDYASAPDAVRAAPWLHVSGRYHSECVEESIDCEYFVDARMLLACFEAKTQSVRTCYRFHEREGVHMLKVTLDTYFSVIDRVSDWTSMRGGKGLSRITHCRVTHKNFDHQKRMNNSMRSIIETSSART